MSIGQLLHMHHFFSPFSFAMPAYTFQQVLYVFSLSPSSFFSDQIFDKVSLDSSGCVVYFGTRFKAIWTERKK